MEKLTLGSHYTIKNIIRQCAAPILMMLFISIYGVVDGLFIANFDATKDQAFAGVNLIYPIICIVGGAGFMFGSGGSALASKFLGEGRKEDASKVFSMMIQFAFLLGVILSLITFPFIDELVEFLAQFSDNTTQIMKEKATLYGRILIWSQPFFILTTLFQNFFVVDEKQNIGFIFTLASGITNIIFDALFIAGFGWGVVGAAIGTMLGHLVGSIGPILYFVLSKNNLITLVKTKFDFKIIGKCSFNGLSDFIFNISANIIGIVYNIQLLHYLGQAGLVANGIIMYISFIFISIFIGIIMGMAPVIGYNFGEGNKKELKFTIKNCFIVLAVLSIAMVLVSEGLANVVVYLFVKDKDLYDLSVIAIRIYSIAFLFMGFSIFLTGMFTALNNGLVSGILSLFRSFIFQILYVVVLPLLMGSIGIWCAIIFTEVSSLVFGIILFIANKKKYGYV